MPSERKEVSTETVLNNILIGYQQDEKKFIADKVFPIIKVKKSSGVYWEFDMHDWNQARMKPRADGAKSASTTFKKKKGSYDAEAEALSIPVTWKSLEEADKVLNLEKAHVSFLHNQDMMTREINFGENFFKAGIWTGTTTGNDITITTKFDEAGSDPIKVIRDGIIQNEASTGFRPNKVVVSAYVHEAIVSNQSVIARIQSTSGKSINTEMIRELLEVDEYVVARSVTSIDGSMSFTFPDNVLICYTPSAPAKELPSAGYIFERDHKTTSRKVETIDDKTRKVTLYEIEDEYDMKQVCAQCGALIVDVLAA